MEMAVLERLKTIDEKLKIQFMKLRSDPPGKAELLLKITGSQTGC